LGDKVVLLASNKVSTIRSIEGSTRSGTEIDAGGRPAHVTEDDYRSAEQVRAT